MKYLESANLHQGWIVIRMSPKFNFLFFLKPLIPPLSFINIDMEGPGLIKGAMD